MVEKTFTTAFSIASDFGSVGAGTAAGAVTVGGAPVFSARAGSGSTAARRERERRAAVRRMATGSLPRKREGECMAANSARGGGGESQNVFHRACSTGHGG